MTAVCYLIGSLATLAALVFAGLTLAIYREMEIERRQR